MIDPGAKNTIGNLNNTQVDYQNEKAFPYFITECAIFAFPNHLEFAVVLQQCLDRVSVVHQ